MEGSPCKSDKQHSDEATKTQNEWDHHEFLFPAVWFALDGRVFRQVDRGYRAQKEAHHRQRVRQVHVTPPWAIFNDEQT